MNQDKEAGNYFLEGLVNAAAQVANCYRYFFKQLFVLGRSFWLNFGLGLVLCAVLSFRDTELWLLHRLLPELFTHNFVLRLSLINTLDKFSFLTALYTVVTFYLVGLRQYAKVRRCERAFKKVGIKNSLGTYPKVVDYTNTSPYRSKVRLLIDGIDTDEFTRKSNALESAIKAIIEDVKREQDPSFIDLYLTKKQIPKRVLYTDLCSQLVEPYTFLVGESLGGILIQDISHLPHALFAGSTGSGKSVFIKAVTMSLLEGSPRLQVYLIDLKHGLELTDFTVCPSVQMVKEVSDALLLLRQIRDEMRRRFVILEQGGFNRIDPERDKLDRILVVIDEASVLYASNRVSASDKALAQEASEITDEIAKLSRAAGIHLIFATQKVTKESISTHIQENLEGRMCFEVNSLQGSNTILGNGAAKELPHIPGRGIWKVGATMTEVQTPFIDAQEIKSRCKRIAEEFKSGKRTLERQMFSTKERKQKSGEAVDKMLGGKPKGKNG